MTQLNTVQDVVQRLNELDKSPTLSGSGEYSAFCPSHDDKKHKSLTLKKGDVKPLVVYCHKGCDFQDIIRALESPTLHYGPSKPLPTGNIPKKPQGKVNHHKILNFDGVHVATHVRTDYWDKNGEKAKDFHWLSPDGTIGLQGIKTADLPLYGAELLRGLSAGTAVVITEGEKAAGALRKMGMVAVGTVSGAKLIPSVESLSPLVDFDLLAWPDNDEVGHQHMDRICDRLWTDFNNKSVRIVAWKDAPYKGDAFDAIQQEVDIEALLADAKTSHPRPQSQDAGPTGPTKEIHPLTQLGNSERLVDTLGHVLSYSPELGWLMYDSTRWRHVEDEEVEHRAKAVVRSIHHEAGNEEDSERRGAISKWARTSEAKANITAMVSLAKGDVFAKVDSFDRHPHLFNVSNGTLDLNTQTLRPHNPQDLFTRVSPVEFDPEARCPTWDRFLKRIFESHPEIPAYLQAVVGYSLTGSTKEQIALFLYGLGENGKTTFVETVMELFGVTEYCSKVSAETFLSSGRTNIGPQPELASLKGVRLVTATESEAGRFLNETLLKEITGGDTITARMLYRNPFSFRPEFQIFLATNNRPVIREQTHALWRRIRLIPFVETITAKEKNPYLGELLRAEELPGILNWALEGYRMYSRDGLRTPQAVIDETEAYQSDEDPIGDFLTATCVLDPEASISLSALNHVYKGWCETNGQKPKDVRWLGRMLTQKGFQRTARTRQSRGNIIGIRVKNVGENAGG